MKENFPDLVKEIDMQVQEAQIVPNKMDPKSLTPRHIIIKMQRLKINKEFSKQQEKAVSYVEGSSHQTVNWFLKGNFADNKGLARSIQSHGKQGPIAKIALPIKAII